VHNSGIPWQDASGNELRRWLGVTEKEFYNERNFALVPMGFCYPGRGTSGDMPPRPECAPQWHAKIMAFLKEVKLILLIGQYAQKYYLTDKWDNNLTQTVKAYRNYLPVYFPLPHPSPRNRIWQKKNPWFEKNVIPALAKQISKFLE
jgi:uracil-DNA glycosylase